MSNKHHRLIEFALSTQKSLHSSKFIDPSRGSFTPENIRQNQTIAIKTLHKCFNVRHSAPFMSRNVGVNYQFLILNAAAAARLFALTLPLLTSFIIENSSLNRRFPNSSSTSIHKSDVG